MKLRVLLLAILAVVVCLPAGAGTETSDADTAQLVVFYFHGNMRCKTCRTIEALSEKAIKQGFAEELESGKLAWRVVNVDEPENKHFVEEFELVTRSVVLAELKGSVAARWKTLSKVWQLVGDEDKFVAYIQAQTREFLKAD